MAQLVPLLLIISYSSKSRLVLPFWYQLTQIVPDKGPLNGCCYLVIVTEILHTNASELMTVPNCAFLKYRNSNHCIVFSVFYMCSDMGDNVHRRFLHERKKSVKAEVIKARKEHTSIINYLSEVLKEVFFPIFR